MKCSNVPDKNLPSIPLFEKGTLAYNINFDVVAFDTYDYIDKIISFKLKDIFYAIFFEIYLSENDMRALKFSEYLKYGTADSKEILLLRYGFSFETIEWLKPYVENISEDEIVFKKTNELSEDQLKEIQIYLDD
jgi:c-di-AMP phosphodiesterase-like protein